MSGPPRPIGTGPRQNPPPIRGNPPLGIQQRPSGDFRPRPRPAVPNQQPPPPSSTLVENLRPDMKNLTVVFIVAKDLNSEDSTEAVNGVRRFLVADSTAKILLNVVNEYPDIKPMDILKVTSAYTMVYKDKLTLCCGKNATIMKTGEFMMPIGMKNMSEERRTEGSHHPEGNGSQGPARRHLPTSKSGANQYGKQSK